MSNARHPRVAFWLSERSGKTQSSVGEDRGSQPRVGSPIRAACSLLLGIAILGIVLVTPISAQTNRKTSRDELVTFSVEIDRPSAHVIDPIKLTLVVEAPRGTRIKFPELGTGLGPFEIVDWKTQAELPTEGDHPARRSLAIIEVESIHAGDLIIPSLEIQYRLPDTPDWDSLNSNPIEVRIVSLLEDRPDPSDFRDIKPPVDIEIPDPASRRWTVWVAAGALVAIGVAWLAVFAIRRRSQISPAQWALRQLESLEHDAIWKEASPELAYGELSSIIRQFIHLQYEISPSSQSSSDLVAAISNQISDSDREFLKEFLTLADEVRFAKRSLDQGRLTIAMQWARKFLVDGPGAADV